MQKQTESVVSIVSDDTESSQLFRVPKVWGLFDLSFYLNTITVKRKRLVSFMTKHIKFVHKL